MDLMGRRWNVQVMLALSEGAERFGELRAAIPGISDRLLSQRLKELGQANLLVRIVIPTAPVQVRYRPSPIGSALLAAFEPLARWGEDYFGEPESRQGAESGPASA